MSQSRSILLMRPTPGVTAAQPATVRQEARTQPGADEQRLECPPKTGTSECDSSTAEGQPLAREQHRAMLRRSHRSYQCRRRVARCQ
jgi:hypothetical protein